MNFQTYLQNHFVCLDGGMGTLLQARGLQAGELPERWNVTHPEEIIAIQQAYFDAGSNVVATNTFGANALKFGAEELERIVMCAVANAKTAMQKSTAPQEKFVALDIGPLGKLLKPLGDLDFEDAVSIFAETVRLGVRFGVDLILIETMNDAYETKAAVLAAKEHCDLPILVSNAYGADGKLMTGATPHAMVALLEGLGVTALGANCSLGPKQLRGVAEELLAHASVPVLLKPNAGLPCVKDGCTHFDVAPDEFAEELYALIQKGLRIAGGCCGTTPEYIRALTAKHPECLPLTPKTETVVSSYSHAVTFGEEPVLIGERINPTGKKRFRQALVEGDMDYILNEGVRQADAGVHLLDVNVGLPEIDEPQLLTQAVCELQAVLNLPLQIDTADPIAMERALRRYNGKALVNSVNGKAESMAAVFPLVQKYGGVVIALTLDESGIPDTAEGRVAIAKKILDTAKTYGIDKKNLIFDPLAMTVSADNRSALVTLEALERIGRELGCYTSLGVSNVSFGLPNRDAINGTFFALALERGLSAAILNPHSAEMMRTYLSFCALHGLDENCANYVEHIGNYTLTATDATQKAEAVSGASDLQHAIIKGFCERAGSLCKVLLETVAPLEIVQNEIIPALNTVGQGFEAKTVYLPQLLMSAEAAKSAFEQIKLALPQDSGASRGTVVLATVHGDIHDIGKNIVKLLLENYGFTVIDLGRDVPPEQVVEAAIAHQAPLVGLSALMTTTVPAMEETILLLRKEAPFCRVVVGGAVLTQEYADRIGADRYARDAMETVRYAEEVFA